ncbi:MAG: urease accessory protein UreF [Chloroflexota bacterium]
MQPCWLDILQVLDSAFPTGAFAHAAGLETLSLPDRSAASIQLAVDERIRTTLGRFELVFVVHARTDDLRSLDDALDTMLLVRETREASAVVGRSLLNSTRGLVDSQRLAAFRRAAYHAHHAVVFGAVAQALEMTEQASVESYAFGAVRSLISAAQRLGWLGQTEAQRILHTLKPTIRAAVDEAHTLELADAGAFAPRWDLAAMVHERAPRRMFAS